MVGGGVHIKFLALALLDSVYYPSDCDMLQLIIEIIILFFRCFSNC